MIVVGIDAGLYSTKVLLLRDGEVLGQTLAVGGMEPAAAVAQNTLERLLADCGVSSADVDYKVATGRGREFLKFVDEAVPDFICQARALAVRHPSVRTVLDMGAQHSMAFRCRDGIVDRIATHDKCATGTGSYLEMVANILLVPLSEMGVRSLTSTEPVSIDTTCAVFAESEIISLIHSKKKLEDILSGVYRSLAVRLRPLLLSVGIEKDIAFIGAVAQDVGVRSAVEAQIGSEVLVPENPQYVAAYGAALVANEKAREGRSCVSSGH